MSSHSYPLKKVSTECQLNALHASKNLLIFNTRYDSVPGRVSEVLKHTRTAFSNFAFPNSALLPTGIKASKDHDLS